MHILFVFLIQTIISQVHARVLDVLQVLVVGVAFGQAVALPAPASLPGLAGAGMSSSRGESPSLARPYTHAGQAAPRGA